MKELIEELKHNKNINIEKGLENRVDIDYIIERLENIQGNIENILSFFKYHNKNLTKLQDEKIQLLDDIITDIKRPLL